MSAEEIKTFRESIGLTQAELAKKLGVSQESVCQWERKKKRPSRPVLMLFDHLRDQIRDAAKKS